MCVSSANKCLDTRSNSSDVEVQDESAKFTYEKMMRSFDDPTCSLFMDSVNAELTQFPELLDMNPDEAEKYAPNAAAFSNGGRRYVKSIYIGVSKRLPVFFNTPMLAGTCLLTPMLACLTPCPCLSLLGKGTTSAETFVGCG